MTGKMDKIVRAGNILLPLAGLALVIYYMTCDTDCLYLQGTLLGIDLEVTGILFMIALLALNVPLGDRFGKARVSLRTVLLASALGSEVILVHFQVVNEFYCPYCVAFGVLVLALCLLNAKFMKPYLALASFAGGVLLFHFFFQGSIIALF